MEAYRLYPPSARRIPIVLSVPHCGTVFPEDISEEYNPQLTTQPDDTDWFVDRLYSFAPSLGVTMITAVYHRWVIDLNRDPDSQPLYSDGRIITDLCPVTTFLGQPLYEDGRRAISNSEIERRKQLYFSPYHNKINELLENLKAEFGAVLLWDCHSIRQLVPTIQKERFPDLILGSNDGRSAATAFIDEALQALSSGTYSLQHNSPFKGGYITRKYGSPAIGQHALQLEMSKINYMDDREVDFHPKRAKELVDLLYKTISRMAEILISGKDH